MTRPFCRRRPREFYYFAKSLDKDARLLAIPDEGHIIKERKNIDTMCVFITGELKLDEVVCESEYIASKKMMGSALMHRTHLRFPGRPADQKS